MSKLLHISANQFGNICEAHHTKKIWKELSKGFDEYHIIARSKQNRYEYSKEGNIHLHLLPSITKSSKSFFFTSFFMLYIIKKYSITHLLSQCPILGGLTGIISSKLFNIPIMIEIHGDVYFRYIQGNSMFDRLCSKIFLFTLKNATKVRSLSSEMTKILNYHSIKDNIVLIPNRVDLSTFSNNKTNYKLNEIIKVVSVGRFVEQKGYDIAIEAIKELSKKYKIELYLIGGGKLYDKFVNQIEGFKNIKLIKWISQEELRALINDADIYIQPSKPFLGEAMPRTILEAMAMRIPIISTNIAAIPGILTNMQNSILINPNSQEELCNAIELLINNEELRKNIAINAYEDVLKKYEWNNVFNLYRSEILNMC